MALDTLIAESLRENMDGERKDMKPKVQRVPNLLLRRQRLLHGWSLQRVVDEICALSAPDGRIPGVSAAMVSCWEMGKKKPSPFYQERMCLIYGLAADQLGFMDAPVLSNPNQSSGVSALARSSTTGQQVILSQPMPPVTKAMTMPFTSVVPREQIQAIDVLTGGTQHTPDEQLGAWLTLGANHLSILLDTGWSSEQLLDAVRVVLQGVQGLPAMTRRKLLQLSGAASIIGITLLTGDHVSEEERIRLTQALGKSIIDGWKLFHTISTDLLFTIAEAQLFMMQQVHALHIPSVRCMFYSSIYRLKGAALFFLARYNEAMKAFDQSYIAGLEANDPWNMAESLSWQGGIWKACGMQARAIQTTEAALRLTYGYEETKSLPLRARLFAHWAESAALLHQPGIMREKLEASADLLKCLETNDEFDFPSWKQYRAVCNFYIGEVEAADRYFQQALEDMKPDWILQKGYTLLLQAQARLKMGEIDRSITAAHTALPFIARIDSPLINRGLMDYVQEVMCFSNSANTSIQAFAAETQRLTLQADSMVPRYLKAKI